MMPTLYGDEQRERLDIRRCEKTGKRIFSGPNSARREVRRRHASFRLFTYRCEHCRYWHVANGDKREGRR